MKKKRKIKELVNSIKWKLNSLEFKLKMNLKRSQSEFLKKRRDFIK